MRRIIPFAVAAAIATAVPAEVIGKPQGEAEVTADKLSVDHKQRLARFEGHVRALFDKLTLTCQRMSLRYDDAGEVKDLRASGQVTVTREDVRATADRVRLDATSGRLVLEGHPVLVKGPHRLTGQRIEVDLVSGAVEIREARGRFRFAKGGP